MALGASADSVVRLVLAKGVRLSIVGALFGLFGAFATARTLESVMVGVQPRSPLTFAGVALGLVAVSSLASYIPARRATRIDPVEALRPE